MPAGQDGDGVHATADWTTDHRFEVIVGVPAFRDAASTCAASAGLPMSAEQFLAVTAAAFPVIGFDRAIIPGQLYDLGKSKQTIADLFADLFSLPESATIALGVPAILTAHDDNS
jgi:hypothetical protein